jgi:pimeloyl-ACP methyl ester carboxylesterase
MPRSRNRYYQGPVREHFDGTRFLNPGQPSTDRGLVDVLRWRLTSAAARWPKSVPVTPAKPDERVSGLRITMVGHAYTLIQVAGVNILTDPVWSERAGRFSFVGPKRVTNPGIDFDDLPPIESGAIKKTPDGFTYIDPAQFHELFAADLPDDRAAFMARSQVLNFADSFSATISTAAWRTKPSWMVVAGSDRTINPDLERWYAKRADSHAVEVAGASHSVYVSHPKEVADVIESAARAVSK